MITIYKKLWVFLVIICLNSCLLSKIKMDAFSLSYSLNMASYYFNLHDYERAFKYSNKAIKELDTLVGDNKKTYFIVYAIRGISQYKLKNYNDAISDLLEGKKILKDLEEDDVLWSVGGSFAEEKTKQEIISRFNYYIGLCYYNLGELSSAMEHLLLAKNIYPYDYNINLLLGCIYLKENNIDQSKQYLNKLKELNKDKKSFFNADKCEKIE